MTQDEKVTAEQGGRTKWNKIQKGSVKHNVGKSRFEPKFISEVLLKKFNFI